jgi:hypothetical protein
MTVSMECPHAPEMSDYAYDGLRRTDSFQEFDAG